MATIDRCFSECFGEPASSSAPVVCALTGTGGMGKTQTALEYAYSCRENRHLTAVFWLLAATEDNIRTSFVDVMQRIVEEQARISWPESLPEYGTIARSLGIPGLVDKKGKVSFEPGSLDIIRSAVFNWLGLPGNTKWLLIFDNVDDLTFGIEKYFPTRGSGGVIVTSRRPEFSHCAEQLPLDGLDLESSTDLLLNLVQLPNPTQNEKNDAIEVVKRLGFMPLAINHAGCFINTMNISIDGYLKYYNKAFKEAQSQVPKFGWNYRDETAVTTWEVSFLAVKSQDEEAASLLLSCSYLNRNEIPEYFWEIGEDGEWEENVDAQLKQKSKFSLLASYSLINRNQPGSFSIHPVVHEWARERVDSRDRFQYIRGALRVISKLKSLQNDPFCSKYTWGSGEGRRLMDHAMVLCKYLNTEFIQHEWRDYQLDSFVGVKNVGAVLNNQSKYSEAFQLYQGVLEWEKRVSGEDSLGAFTTQSVMASILDHQGKHSEALELQQNILARRKALKQKGPQFLPSWDDNIAVLGLIHNTALSFANLGRYNEALKYYHEAAVGKEKVLGKNHSSTLLSLASVATMLGELDQPDEAMKYHQIVLARQKEGCYGSEIEKSRFALCTMKSQGVLANQQHKYDEALEYFQNALAWMKQIYDPNHVSIFAITRDIATVLYNQDKHSEALEWYNQSLDGFKRVLGEDSPDSLSVMRHIARVFQAQHLYDKAIGEYKKVLAKQEEKLRQLHPETLRTFQSLGSAYSDQGKYEEALHYYRIALAGKEKTWGRGHRNTVLAIYEIALVLLSQKEYSDALKWFYKALSGFEGLGPNSLLLVGPPEVMMRIALIFVEQKKFKKALEWCSKALAFQEKTLGKDDPKTIELTKTVANIKSLALYDCIIT
ncbi:hypothetical protein TWF481_007939 [Arthrobotrys musiformis]|uniref:NB-ARC domain-containing protein n=1 Tax=Arthrobotrys musiformis TaxID=47236 RepID=A0AAV9W5S8_9PEZI